MNREEDMQGGTPAGRREEKKGIGFIINIITTLNIYAKIVYGQTHGPGSKALHFL